MSSKTGQKLLGYLAAMALISVIAMGLVILYGQHIRAWFATTPAFANHSEPDIQPQPDTGVERGSDLE